MSQTGFIHSEKVDFTIFYASSGVFSSILLYNSILPFFSEFVINTPYFVAEKQVTALLKEVGAKGEKKDIETMIKKLDGKDIPKLIAEGMGKFAAIGGGGGGEAAPAEAAPTGGDAPKEEKKKEKEPEPEKSDEDIGGFFGEEDDY